MSSLSTAGIDVGHEIARGLSPWVEPSRLVVVRREHESVVRARLPLWADDSNRAPGARVVKQSRVRTVLRMPANPPLPSIYVKIHHVLGAWNSLRSAIRASRARRELGIAAALESRGVLAPRPIALAEWRRGPVLQRTVTVWQEIEDATPLDVFLASLDGEPRLAALDAIGSELAARHAAGIDLVDCHRGNLLAVSSGGAGAPRLGLVDLSSVRFDRPSREQRVRRLAQLLHSLEAELRADEGGRLLAAYRKASPNDGVPLEELARAVRDASARIAMQRERSRDRRCVVDSTEFSVAWSPWRRVFRRRDCDPAALRTIADAIGRGEARVVQCEGRNECFVAGAGAGARFVKRARASTWLGAVADAFRGSRGRRAWIASHAFLRRGLPTPRAHALVEDGPLVPWRSTLVVDAVEGAATLREVAAEWKQRFPRLAERRAFLRELAETVARLHVAGVDHDDLATKNFLVVAGPPRQFLVIDLEAVRSVGRRLPRERVLRALMQLDDCPRAVSRTDRMRFLVDYERATKQRFTRSQIAEVRAMLRERFERSKRDFESDGPR